MRTSPPVLSLALLLAVLGATTATAANARVCSDPCLQAAKAEYLDCASGASGTLRDTMDACLERDPQCIDACRSVRQDCRDGTGASGELLQCLLEGTQAKAECRDRFPLGSTRRVICVDRAQIAAFGCRRGVRRHMRRVFRDCRVGFRQCAHACGPGVGTGGVRTCRAQGKAAFKAALSTCKRTLGVTTSACLEKDLTCSVGCGDARDTCTAPTQATLDAAMMACTTQERADLAACQAANPGGGPSLDPCVTAARASASTCRDQAVQDAGPGFAACTQQYLRCVRACPPPQS